MTYWAHSDPNGLSPGDPGSEWQTLADHLRQVSALAEILAQDAKPGDAGFQASAKHAGILHDYGKYTACFQNMIRTGMGRCPHSAHGAALIHAAHPDAAFAIAGHHAGIPDRSGGTGTLATRIKEAIGEADGLREAALKDCPGIGKALPFGPVYPLLPIMEFDLRTRMLFSIFPL